MTANIHAELYQCLGQESFARLQFTRKAFRLLPELERPQILDIGCGRGVPTLELAKLGARSHIGGQVVGLDIHRPSLEELLAKAAQQGLAGRVRTVLGSMSALPFPNERFDVLWSEGALHVIGLEAGLQSWKRLLQPGGFLVIHEMAWLRPDPPREIVDRWQPSFPDIGTVKEYVARALHYGYELVGHFCLPEEYWWLNFYMPVEARIQKLRDKHAADPQIQDILDREQREVDLYKRHAAWYGSAFLAMAKV